MGLLTPKGKKGDKKNKDVKNTNQSKFINKGGLNASGFVKKQKPGSANRGS